MQTTSKEMPGTTRRRLLQAGLAWAAAPSFATVARASAGGTSGRTCVLLHLAGGNDGLNTVIPFADPLYYELRPRLSRAARSAIRIDDQMAFHSSLSALVPLLERGDLAIVQGVGYADPDYSHVGSCRIWSTGGTDPAPHRTWWDRMLDPCPTRVEVSGLCAGADPAEYAPGEIGQTLAAVLRQVESKHSPALVLASVGGFDTHTDQLRKHADVLRELGDGLAAFQRELDRLGAADRVILMAWSEFGRRPAENATGGTDHGSAGPVFVIGTSVQGGLYGQAPSLENTDFGNLIPAVDFRAVYSILARRWLRSATATPPDEVQQPLGFLL